MARGGVDSRQISPVWERITEALGISSVNLISIRLDVARQSVYDWQKGKMPAIESMVRIADVSRASIHWLITGEGPRRVNESPKSPAGPVTIYLGEAEHSLITRLATNAGISKEEQIRDLILENLSQRGLIKTAVERPDVHSSARHLQNLVKPDCGERSPLANRSIWTRKIKQSMLPEISSRTVIKLSFWRYRATQ